MLANNAGAQEVFNFVAAHLLAQNAKAALGVNTGQCQYRTLDGLKCAVGCLIPDEVYTPFMEGKGIVRLAECKHFVLPAYILQHIDLLAALQVVHDCHLVGQWRGSLEAVAVHFKLTTEALA